MSREPPRRRWRRPLLGSLALLIGLPTLAALIGHFAIAPTCRIDPPALELAVAPGEVRSLEGGKVRILGRSSVRELGSLLQVRLEGHPEEIGHAHARLLYDDMVATERAVWQLFHEHVSRRWARALLLDIARVSYRDVDEGMSKERVHEIAAGAAAFQPDPFDEHFDTFERFVHLNALYDISLSFEHSPLIGCTSLALRTGPERGRGTLLARAFDFEVHDIFDERKAVFLVREHDQIPFASVAWPGLVGVVSGINLEGVSAVVHGARAGEPQRQGEPVVHALRRVLSKAHSSEEALALLREGEPMVSHIVVLGDAAGVSMAVERVPGEPPHVRRLGPRGAVSNHLEGPSADDPKNQRVREQTSTLDRRARADELVTRAPARPTIADAVAMLRDRRGPGDRPLPLGDRRAIDALIATHGVVLDSEERMLWVSEAPHLLGSFVGFDLRRLLAPDYDVASDDGSRPRIPADPLLRDLGQASSGPAGATPLPTGP